MALGIGALAAIMGGASVVSSLVSGLFGSSSTSSTNSSNYKIAQETNENNYKIAQETNQTNLDIAQMNNEYNEQLMNTYLDYYSPSNQRSMYEDAGLNYQLIASGGGSSSQASTTPNYATAPTMQGANMQAAQMQADQSWANAFNQIGNTLGNIVGNFAQARKNNSEANQVDIDNVTEGARKAQELIGMAKQNDNIDLLNTGLGIDNYYKGMLYDSQLQQAFLQNQNLKASYQDILAQTTLTKLLTQEKHINLNTLGQENVARIAQIQSQTALQCAQVGLTYEQMCKTSKESVLLDEGLKSAKINNKILNETAKYQIDRQNYEAMKAKFDAISAEWNSYDFNYNSYLNKNSKGYKWRHYIEGFTKALLPLAPVIKK